MQRLWNEFETGGFMAQKDMWNVAREKISQTEVKGQRKKGTL